MTKEKLSYKNDTLLPERKYEFYQSKGVKSF